MGNISSTPDAAELAANKRLKLYANTQPTCAKCYPQVSVSGRDPVPVLPEGREIEKCCSCGKKTKEGIYAAVDVNAVQYPTNKFHH